MVSDTFILQAFVRANYFVLQPVGQSGWIPHSNWTSVKGMNYLSWLILFRLVDMWDYKSDVAFP
jgi:hypothetical protein